MRILLCGQKRFGRDTAQLCQRLGHEIAAVYCQADPTDKLRIYCENQRLPARPAGTLRADAVPPGTDLIIAARATTSSRAPRASPPVSAPSATTRRSCPFTAAATPCAGPCACASASPAAPSTG